MGKGCIFRHYTTGELTTIATGHSTTTQTMTNKILILLLLGLIATEAHGIIFLIWPQTATIEYDLFLSNSGQKISVLWYVFELGNILDKIIWAFALTKIAVLVSTKLFYIGIVFFAFYTIGLLFYVWDRNTSFLRNYLVYTIMANIIITILIPEKKQSIYRQME